MACGTTKILIIEDEILIAEYIKELLSEEGFIMKMAHERNTALLLFSSFCPDIILMDINIDGSDTGIELAKVKNPEAHIIFLTSQNDMATMKKALATNPGSYLTKPIRKTDLMAAIQLAQQRKAAFITIKDGYDMVRIFHDDILYIKSDNMYLDIYTKKRIYTIRMTLEKLMQELDPLLFCKPHRSYVVNRSAISRKSSNAIYIDNLRIPISRNFFFEL